MAKASRATVQERIRAVYEIRVAFGTFRDIVQYASEQKWRVSDRQLWNYVARADEIMAKEAEAVTADERKRGFNLAVAQRLAVGARAFEAADWRVVLAVLKDIGELCGHYPGSLRELQDQIDELKREHFHGGKRTNQEGPAHAEGNTRANGHTRAAEPGRVPGQSSD